jgi:uncharacterized protein YkwD
MKFISMRFVQCFNLCCVAVTLLVASQQLAQARETYVVFADRMVATAKAENAIRPDLEAQLAGLANAFRKSKGLPALAIDEAAHAAARAHAMDMMLHNFMGHVASTGQDFDSRMRALNGGAMILPGMAENAARVSKPGLVDRKMAASLFQQWVKSPPHRKALLSRDYLKVATGVVSKGGQLYADQIFTGPAVSTNMGRVVPAEKPGVY